MTTQGQENLIQAPQQPVLDVQYILSNYHKLSGDQIETALGTPNLQTALLSIISKCNEHQLKQIVRRMNLDQIKTTIPKLQLQQTGVCVQVMTPSQIRKSISSLTSDDRHILRSNISLLSSCTNKDELQSFVSFIDPLAMCVAVENAELCKKIIESAAAMTVEQIRVVIPLLDLQQIRDICREMKEDLHIETVVSMIDSDRKAEMISILEQDMPTLQTRRTEISPRLKSIKEELPRLTAPMHELSTTCNKQEKYNEIVRRIKNLKTEIEAIQRSIRELQAYLPFPIKYISQDRTSYDTYLGLENQLKGLAREAYNVFISIDKSASELGVIWRQVEPGLMEETIPEPVMSPDSVYEDERAILLYEAVKEIGNPDAVANIYSMTWSQIIQAGFRSADDFKRKGVATLEQLQKYIDEFPA